MLDEHLPRRHCLNAYAIIYTCRHILRYFHILYHFRYAPLFSPLVELLPLPYAFIIITFISARR